jgi:hypothetical protein
MRTVYLASRSVEGSARALSNVGREFGLENIFNPSVLVDGSRIFCAFRALPVGESKPFRAYLAVFDAGVSGVDRWDGCQLMSFLDLTKYSTSRGGPIVADPKLLRLGGKVFATFNTGQPIKGELNDVYLVRIAPNLGPIQRCRLLGDRMEVEKNWSFVDSSDGLRALYGLSPLVTLTCVGGEVGSSEDLVFQKSGKIPTNVRLGVSLSIGTQLSAVDNEYRFICHEKVGLRSRRAYFGRACSVILWKGSFKELRVSGRRLLNSFGDALPHRPKHNRALISATYFSGLDFTGRSAIVSYGVNDVKFGVANVQWRELW